MRGYFDPPEEPELPVCCGEFMDYSDDDHNCRCIACGKVIEPDPDPDPFLYFPNSSEET